ncbi:MAG: S66 peptidase family protein [Alkaliphilus sp.]
MIRPKALKKENCIGIVAPSSTASQKEVELSKKQIEEIGFKVKIGKSCYGKYGYLSGGDGLRAKDINTMFEDKDVDAIFCLRGGYGAIRMLDRIDYEIVKKNPKIFVGYSDITAIHIAINQKCKLITFHGPMVSADMIPIFDDFAKKSLIMTITQTQPLGIMKNPEGMLIKRLVGRNSRR